jgi:plasmid stability protein
VQGNCGDFVKANGLLLRRVHPELDLIGRNEHIEVRRKVENMPNINVRGLSEQTKSALRVKAAHAGLSLEAYARRALQKAALADSERATVCIAQLAARHFGPDAGVELNLPKRSTERPPVDFV